MSVLFADLVGFTGLSEHRDPEEVRELLSRYFDRCRTLIERYGGTIEKFIGDAVMAVWGTPVAREDDPERAVRAGLALTQAIALLGEEVGMPDLRIRAGVLTGNAAVDIGAESEGMVLGDTVNTAARLQSLASPGTVLVDDVTRRSTEAAIAYEDAGTHEVKGREQPVRAWTALRVVAGVGGALRGAGLEAPLVGRDRELQTIIEISEESAAASQARHVTVIGEAGSGKTRLLWEFFKYLDGIERVVRWHQGRCLSYGEGVAYWALAEMVRARAGIVEEEDATSAREKLRATVAEFVPDERERRLVEPRLAHLLGLEQRTASDRADLFSGWRLFFERLSEQAPVILAFEDLQWADSGLLDFIDYLLEWSAERPLLVLALGRPELLNARPAWRSEAMLLEPLPDAAMRKALEGLVPGLPEDLLARIVSRAEGVPLYAVETVRMLLDRGLLSQEGSRYVLTGDVGELDVPETLHALAAARLDGLTTAERAVLQDASVYGQSFMPAGVAALSNQPQQEVECVLDALVSKQVLAFNDNPRSAERGQYHFLQGLLRTTAYATLSRRDRKNGHLAAARYLQEAWGGDAPEMAEVLASHFLAAADAEPDATDAPRIRASACETLEDAGKRALSLALAPEALRAFDRAAELAQDEIQRAALLDQAGRAAMANRDFEGSIERLQQAVAIFESRNEPERAARSLAAVAEAMFRQDRLEEAIDLMRRALAALAAGGPDRAAALSMLATLLTFDGKHEEALEAADAALTIGEPLEQWKTVVSAFQTVAMIRGKQGRQEESRALRERSLALALEHDLTSDAMRAYNNLADYWLQLDRFTETLSVAERGLALAKSRGDRLWEPILSLIIMTARVGLGEWDVVPKPTEDGYPAGIASDELVRLGYPYLLARVQAGRGDTASLQRTLELATAVSGTQNVEWAATPNVAKTVALRALGRYEEALETAMSVATGPGEIANEDRREACLEGGLAALELGNEEAVERLVKFVADMPSALRTPLLRSTAARFEGLLAARRGDAKAADERLAAAARELGEIEAPFNLAQILLDHAEFLSGAGREDEAAPLLAQARAIFERLGARPWLERADALRPAVAA
ncbi:MAG TPA: adenylate/guanylate cyclase domain-containing protein [Solirubrobacteraceae bacterium]|nr:adenylate/guanylate cyclase domain-containing protein [Solirubrobacteraceae bacterium]